MTNQTLKIDDKLFNISDLPQHLQTLLDYYNEWNSDVVKLRRETAKTEAAIRESLKELRGELAKLVATGELTPITQIKEESRE